MKFKDDRKILVSIPRPAINQQQNLNLSITRIQHLPSAYLAKAKMRDRY